MGDIKRFRKKYTTPGHPWNATRIKLEKDITRKYGTGNKKEIWRMESFLKSFKDQAKSLLTRTDDQANKEREQMHDKLVRLGMIKPTDGVDDILGLQLKDIMNRRLQTIVVQKRLARSVKHARQLITHEHIIVNGTKVTSPSYLVLAEEEGSVDYAPSSPFVRSDHPERFNEEIAQTKHARQQAKARRQGQELDEIVVFDEGSIEDPEEASDDTEVDASVADLKVEEETPKEKPQKEVPEKAAPQEEPPKEKPPEEKRKEPSKKQEEKK